LQVKQNNHSGPSAVIPGLTRDPAEVSNFIVLKSSALSCGQKAWMLGQGQHDVLGCRMPHHHQSSLGSTPEWTSTRLEVNCFKHCVIRISDLFRISSFVLRI
jgi:hypothetical protein